MKQRALWFVLGLVTAFAGVFAKDSLLTAIDEGKCKRTAADMRSVAAVLEDYRRDHGMYPAGITVDALREFVEPKYIRQVPHDDLAYASDGATYVVMAGFQTGCSYEMRDGRFTRWPHDPPAHNEAPQSN